MHFYEKKVKETLCLLRCNQEYREIAGSRALKTLPRDTEHKLINHRVYEYLHLCYYRERRYQDAANALFTYLVIYPDHEASIETLKKYLTLPGVQPEAVVNLETAPYVSIYFQGVSAYENEDYAQAAALFEASLSSYIQSEEECRFYCEGPFDQGWHPEFTSSVANHFTFCLRCKRACSQRLNNVNGNYRRDMLKSHYNYLQFSYYKLGKLKAACAAVESYLLFDSLDETMQNNKAYYRAQPKVQEEYFTGRQEAVDYLKRQEYELSLLRYISNEFSVIDAKFSKMNKKKKEADRENEKKKEIGKQTTSEVETTLHPAPGHSSVSRAKLSDNLSKIQEERREINDTKKLGVKNVTYLLAKEEDLGGKNRYVADGFLNSTECESLMRFASMTAVEGDGYNENKSPHSKYERFEGITVGRTALMVYFGQIEPTWLEMFLESTEQARDHVERYFGLDRQLYFTYTHLVCRTALADSPMDRNDLSHKVHGDNCLLTDSNTCVQDSPAYVWRDYSAILYLNDDFQGGEFFFATNQTNRKSDIVVSPRCGRMVAFSAGGENLHGVRGVLRGKRCALALWFTQDANYMEYERVLARAILKRVRSIGPFQGKHAPVPLKYEDVLVQHINSDESLKRFLNNS
nr:PREDICTED: prolyl 3-hydroxylase 1-like isoform X2 [Megachile rotundata]